ncbi:hypothetical protein [Acetobacterium woodii]|uniref:hypothetical protein n=1 Tax=Acetobacterium woodii TaxID=33952 RepID=UPI0003160DFA|nr:hypothetical protein [Acetobacterium woodii]
MFDWLPIPIPATILAMELGNGISGLMSGLIRRFRYLKKCSQNKIKQQQTKQHGA